MNHNRDNRKVKDCSEASSLHIQKPMNGKKEHNWRNIFEKSIEEGMSCQAVCMEWNIYLHMRVHEIFFIWQ